MRSEKCPQISIEVPARRERPKSAVLSAFGPYDRSRDPWVPRDEFERFGGRTMFRHGFGDVVCSSIDLCSHGGGPTPRASFRPFDGADGDDLRRDTANIARVPSSTITNHSETDPTPSPATSAYPN